jgi:hypothetical protein
LQKQDDIIEYLLELWMDVKNAKDSNLGDNVLFIGGPSVYSWKNGKKKTKLTNVNIKDEQDLIYFKDLDFDLTFLFELQQNFTQSIVEIYNEIYVDFCGFMKKKKIINTNKSRVVTSNNL